jgi:lipid A 3-O-deacylase
MMERDADNLARFAIQFGLIRRGIMKIIATLVVSLFLAGAAAAQDASSQVAKTQDTKSEDWVKETLKKGTWEFGVFGGGGTGLGKSDNTQFFVAGGRVGRILTGEHLSGWLRGNFEWAVDAMPVYIVFPPDSAVYGGSFTPVIWQWNFTGRKKVAPYFAAQGGVLFSTQNIPPGNTSYVNFTPGGVLGVHIFAREGRAVQLEGGIIHHSNASLGTTNPGYNASFMFKIGYTWYKVAK